MNIMYKVIIIILLPLALLLTTVEVVSFNTDYFVNKYEEYEISKSTGIVIDDLEGITDKLLNYLKDKTDNLEIEKEINGSKRQVFNEKEILHMIDVKDLFIKGKIIRNISMILIIISILYLGIKNKKDLGQAFIMSSALSILSMVTLFLLMYTNFNKYFTYFHEIFFTNDLWLLNPETDVLIQMLPLEFFYSIATKISTMFILEVIILALIGLFIQKTYKPSLYGNN